MTIGTAPTSATRDCPVAAICRVPGSSKQVVFNRHANPVSHRDREAAHRISAGYHIHHDDPPSATGSSPRSSVDRASPRVRTESRRRDPSSGSGRSSPRSRAHRRPGPPVHDSLVARQCTAEGKLYLCAIKDVRSGRTVGYSIDSRMQASLAVAALRNAIARGDPLGTVVQTSSASSRPRRPDSAGRRRPGRAARRMDRRPPLPRPRRPRPLPHPTRPQRPPVRR